IQSRKGDLVIGKEEGYGRGETTLDILKVIHDALRDSSQWHEEKQKQYSTAATITKVRNTESASMIHDIIEASKSNEFFVEFSPFYYVSKHRFSLVDK
ncbi:unnamed protein product, partial [Brassica rapa subsp. narinosa]